MCPEDIAQLEALKREVFGASGSSEGVWRHHYFDVPWGAAPAWVAEADGEIVAALGLLNRRLRVDWADTGKSAQITDNMTAKKGRGRQTFLRLLIWAAHSTIEQDWSLIYGFPNRRAEGALLQMRVPYQPAFTVPYHIRVLRPSPLPQIEGLPDEGLRGRLLQMGLVAAAKVPRLPVPAAARWDVRETAAIPEDADELWAAFSQRVRYANVRDREYLGWRYERNPAASYRFLEARDGGRLRGLMVLSERTVAGASYLVLVDWLALEDSFHALVERAVESATALPHVSGVLTAALPPYSRRLYRHGFIRVPEALSPARMRLWLQLPGHLLPYESPIREAANWHMTMGDSDVV